MSSIGRNNAISNFKSKSFEIIDVSGVDAKTKKLMIEIVKEIEKLSVELIRQSM